MDEFNPKGHGGVGTVSTPKLSVRALVDPKKALFDVYARRWKRDTSGASSIQRKIGHQDYMQIISMGKEALPFIFQDLEQDPHAHWYPALAQITEQSPVPFKLRGCIKEMRREWLRWGKAHGYLG